MPFFFEPGVLVPLGKKKILSNTGLAHSLPKRTNLRGVLGIHTLILVDNNFFIKCS